MSVLDPRTGGVARHRKVLVVPAVVLVVGVLAVVHAAAAGRSADPGRLSAYAVAAALTWTVAVAALRRTAVAWSLQRLYGVQIATALRLRLPSRRRQVVLQPGGMPLTGLRAEARTPGEDDAVYAWFLVLGDDGRIRIGIKDRGNQLDEPPPTSP